MNSEPEMASILDQGSVIVTPANDTFLTIFTLTCSTLGIALSAFALALLLLTAVLFAEWRKNYKNQLLIQFMIARFLYTFVRYFYDVTRVFDLYDRTDIIIQLDTMFVLYTEMALVSWMFFFSMQMFNCLVKVFSVEKRSLWTVSLCAWLFPALISSLLYCAFVSPKYTELWCYAVYLFFLKWPVLVANAVLLILSLKSILNANRSRTASNLRIITVMILLIFFFCFQQVIKDVIFIHCLVLITNYDELPRPLNICLVIFNVLMLYHCAFSILFWLFGNVYTRKCWTTWGKDFKSKNRQVTTVNSTK